jgi:hypothetical protein
MRTRGILLGRVLETVLLLGVIFTVAKSGTGLSFSVLVLNVDFSVGVTRTVEGVVLSTRLFGYLIALVASVAQLDLRRSALIYLSLVLGSIAVMSHLSEVLHGLGYLPISIQAQCAALVVLVDWALYAELRRRSAVAGSVVASPSVSAAPE